MEIVRVRSAPEGQRLQLVKIETFIRVQRENQFATLAEEFATAFPQNTGKRKRTSFNEAAVAFFTAAVPQWLAACSKWKRGDMYDQMLKDAQKPAVVNQLNSAAWTRKTIKMWLENNWRSHAPPAPPEETEDA